MVLGSTQEVFRDSRCLPSFLEQAEMHKQQSDVTKARNIIPSLWRKSLYKQKRSNQWGSRNTTPRGDDEGKVCTGGDRRLRALSIAVDVVSWLVMTMV